MQHLSAGLIPRGMRSPIMAVSNTPFLNGEFPKFDFTAFTDFGKFAEQWEKFDFAKVADQFKLPGFDAKALVAYQRSEEHTSELQSLMRISYAVFCLKKKNIHKQSSTT